MRVFLTLCALVALATAMPVLAATKAPAPGTTIVIKIPAMPTATSMRALKKAMKNMPSFNVHAAGNDNVIGGNAPPVRSNSRPTKSIEPQTLVSARLSASIRSPCPMAKKAI